MLQTKVRYSRTRRGHDGTLSHFAQNNPRGVKAGNLQVAIGNDKVSAMDGLDNSIHHPLAVERLVVEQRVFSWLVANGGQ